MAGQPRTRVADSLTGVRRRTLWQHTEHSRALLTVSPRIESQHARWLAERFRKQIGGQY